MTLMGNAKKNYIFLAYNSFTLCNTIYYCKKYCSDNNVDIIFINNNFNLVKELENEYRVHKVFLDLKHEDDIFNKTFNIIKENFNAIKVLRIIKSIIKSYNNIEKINLIVFKDASIRESTCIEYVKRRFKNKAKIILIEEGVGMYRVSLRKAYHKFRYYVNLFMGVSSYALKRLPYGLHPALDVVVCSSQELLKEKYKKYNFFIPDIQTRENIFTAEWCNVYLYYLTGNDIRLKEKITFVYLTMPWDDNCINLTEKEFDEFMTELFSALRPMGNILIKRHPRDKYDYNKFVDENVFCITEIDYVPFEVVYGLLDKPILIAINSSCCAFDNEKISYYLSDAFPSLPKTPNEYLEKNRIKVCSDVRSLIDEIRVDYFE